jgi:hypothetical protein
MELVRLDRARNSASKKRLAKLLFAIFCFCGFGLELSGQTAKQCIKRADILVEPDKPTVYITYERAGQFSKAPGRLAATDPSDEEKLKGESIKGVWLRLHNNTRWAISFPTESLYLGGTKTVPLRLCNGSGALALRDGIEVNARYEIDILPGHENVTRPRVANRIDVFSDSWLGPSCSIVFVVPREYLKEPLAICLPFHYEWEMEKEQLRSGEPEHRIYFHSWNLPVDVR